VKRAEFPRVLAINKSKKKVDFALYSAEPSFPSSLQPVRAQEEKGERESLRVDMFCNDPIEREKTGGRKGKNYRLLLCFSFIVTL